MLGGYTDITVDYLNTQQPGIRISLLPLLQHKLHCTDLTCNKPQSGRESRRLANLTLVAASLLGSVALVDKVGIDRRPSPTLDVLKMKLWMSRG